MTFLMYEYLMAFTKFMVLQVEVLIGISERKKTIGKMDSLSGKIYGFGYFPEFS